LGRIISTRILCVFPRPFGSNISLEFPRFQGCGWQGDNRSHCTVWTNETNFICVHLFAPLWCSFSLSLFFFVLLYIHSFWSFAGVLLPAGDTSFSLVQAIELQPLCRLNFWQHHFVIFLRCPSCLCCYVSICCFRVRVFVLLPLVDCCCNSFLLRRGRLCCILCFAGCLAGS
jgi:hypothetical protein